jgi:hypothetical protein
METSDCRKSRFIDGVVSIDDDIISKFAFSRFTISTISFFRGDEVGVITATGGGDKSDVDKAFAAAWVECHIDFFWGFTVGINPLD